MNLSISRFRYRFTLHWISVFFAIVVVSLLCSLGVWQLKRADEKRAILAHREAMQSQELILWTGDETHTFEDFEPIAIKGQFLPEVLFLDNQYHNHHIGYHVISPVLMETGRVILVNRGWVPATSTRNQLPEIKPDTTVLNLTGTVYLPPKKRWVLGAGIEIHDNNQAVIESFDFELISQFLHQRLYPFIIRLNPESPGGFSREWVTVVMPPVRHLGYAMQWFGLALVALIVFVAVHLKKDVESKA